VAAQRSVILDPFDPPWPPPRGQRVPDAVIDAARRSPVYRFVKEWQIALPLHPEYRTLPMLFYVPPSSRPWRRTPPRGGELLHLAREGPAAAPVPRLLFTAGNEEIVKETYRKLMAVRLHRRSTQVGDLPAASVEKAMAEARLAPAEADAIYRLTSLAGMDERIVIHP